MCWNILALAIELKQSFWCFLKLYFAYRLYLACFIACTKSSRFLRLAFEPYDNHTQLVTHHMPSAYLLKRDRNKGKSASERDGIVYFVHKSWCYDCLCHSQTLSGKRSWRRSKKQWNQNTITRARTHTNTPLERPTERTNERMPTNRYAASCSARPTFCVRCTCVRCALTCTRFISCFILSAVEPYFNNTVNSLVRIRVSRWIHTLQQLCVMCIFC